jgi:toxin ParE1/3/4
MVYEVRLTLSAEEDLFDIYKYVYEHDSPAHADRLLQMLREQCLTLAEYPARGHIPAELRSLGIDDFSEIIHKPYRIVYQMIEKTVYIHFVLDGRRDIESLLRERLTR